MLGLFTSTGKVPCTCASLLLIRNTVGPLAALMYALSSWKSLIFIGTTAYPAVCPAEGQGDVQQEAASWLQRQHKAQDCEHKKYGQAYITAGAAAAKALAICSIKHEVAPALHPRYMPVCTVIHGCCLDGAIAHCLYLWNVQEA